MRRLDRMETIAVLIGSTEPEDPRLEETRQQAAVALPTAPGAQQTYQEAEYRRVTGQSQTTSTLGRLQRGSIPHGYRTFQIKR